MRSNEIPYPIFWKKYNDHANSQSARSMQGKVVKVIQKETSVSMKIFGNFRKVLRYNTKQINLCAKVLLKVREPAHNKNNKMACAPSEDSDQPGHLPSLIRVFTVRSMGS